MNIIKLARRNKTQRDVLTEWLCENVCDLVHLIFVKFSSPAVQVNLGNFADKMSESSSNTLDDTESESNLVFSSHVGVLHTQQVREIICFLKY